MSAKPQPQCMRKFSKDSAPPPVHRTNQSRVTHDISSFDFAISNSSHAFYLLPSVQYPQKMDVASGIIGVASVGVKLSTTLYTYASSVANADKDMTDIAGDVALTSNVLNNVGTFLQDPDTIAIASGTALTDASSILKRCRDAFTEIEALISKSDKPGHVGENWGRKPSKRAIFAWPLKSSRAELLKKRLESLKSSLMLLLHVLSFARDRANGYDLLFYLKTD